MLYFIAARSRYRHVRISPMCCKPAPIGEWAALWGWLNPASPSQRPHLSRDPWSLEQSTIGPTIPAARWRGGVLWAQVVLARVSQPCVLSPVSVCGHEHCVAVSVLCLSVDFYDYPQINIFTAVVLSVVTSPQCAPCGYCSERKVCSWSQLWWPTGHPSLSQSSHSLGTAWCVRASPKPSNMVLWGWALGDGGPA